MLPGQMLHSDVDGGAKQLSEQSSAPTPTKDANAEKKQTRTRGPKGESPQGLIETLVTDGFFAEEKSAEDVAQALSTKGFAYESGALSTPLTRITRKGLISRAKGGDGKFQYKANS